MRVLVLSLLRLGDVLMCAPAIHAIQRKYPNAEIDLLVNAPFDVVLRPVLSNVKNVIAFDRKNLQDALVDADRPVLEAYDRLCGLVKGLNANKYDVVVNFTQNKVSGYLADLIEAPEKIGLVMSGQGKVSFGSQWMKFINDTSAAGVGTLFHYADIFSNAIGVHAPRAFFKTTPEGEQEAAAVFPENSSGPRIVIQPLTSDTKKNFSTEFIVEVLRSFKVYYPKSQCVFICAPNEVEPVSHIVADAARAGVETRFFPLSLTGALSAIKKADLLVTPDTSIKHLAAGTSTKILEIALGSSDPRKTGAFSENAWIVQSRENCVPCGHEGQCHRQSHVCGESISPFMVSSLMKQIIEKNHAGQTILANEYADQADIFKTHFTKMGFWRADALRATARPKQIEEWLDLTAWRFFLDQKHLESVAPYGSEGLKVLDLIQNDRSGLSATDTHRVLKGIEIATAENEGRAFSILCEISKRIKTQSRIPKDLSFENDVLTEVKHLEQNMDLGNSVTGRIEGLQGDSFRKIRILQSSIQDIFQHQQIKLKLLRTVKSHLTEKS